MSSAYAVAPEDEFLPEIVEPVYDSPEQKERVERAVAVAHQMICGLRSTGASRHTGTSS